MSVSIASSLQLQPLLGPRTYLFKDRFKVLLTA